MGQGAISLQSMEKGLRRGMRSGIRVPVSSKELILTLVVSAIMTPFFFVTFFVLPIMGQITVGVAMAITAIYLWVRRSWLVFVTSFAGAAVVSLITFVVIQAIKYRLDIPLFIFLVMGVPLSVIYCLGLGIGIAYHLNPNYNK